MKITDIRTLCLSHPHEPERQWFSAAFHVEKADCPIVIIDTDAGLQGIAEPSTYGDPPLIRQQLDALKPSLISRDPLDPDLAPKPTGDRSMHIAHAGLELALWDLRAKVQNKTVSELIVPPHHAGYPRAQTAHPPAPLCFRRCPVRLGQPPHIRRR